MHIKFPCSVFMQTKKAWVRPKMKKRENKKELEGGLSCRGKNVLFTDLFIHLYICACLSYYKTHTVYLAGSLQTLHLSLLGMYPPLHRETQIPDQGCITLCCHTDESLWSVTNTEAMRSSGMS